MALPSLRFLIDEEIAPSLIAKDVVVAKLYNDARNPVNGYPYFWPVEKGRRGMGVPTVGGFAAYRFADRGRTIAAFSPERFKSSVFSSSIAPTVPQRIRRAAISDALQTIALMEGSYNNSRRSMVELVNRSASILALALIRHTPSRTGRLSTGYRVTQAE